MTSEAASCGGEATREGSSLPSCSTSDPAAINQALRGGERGGALAERRVAERKGRKEIERQSGRIEEEEQIVGAVFERECCGEIWRYEGMLYLLQNPYCQDKQKKTVSHV